MEQITELLSIWGIPIVFITALIDTLPFVGAIAPEELILALAAFFSDQSISSFLLLWIAASLGMFIGQMLLYKVSRNFGDQLLKWMSVTPEQRKRLADIVASEVIWINVLIRFSSTIKSIVGIICGVTKVKFRKFVIIELTVAIIEPPIYLAIGILLKGNVDSIESLTLRLGSIFLIVSVISGIISIYISRKTKILHR